MERFGDPAVGRLYRLELHAQEHPARPLATVSPRLARHGRVRWPAQGPGMLSRAMILAAGRGRRMRPLTDTRPKPLLPVAGRPLLQWWLLALQDSGVRELVVNSAWLGQQVEDFCRQQALAPGVSLHLSSEGRDFGGALETAGGIARALPRLAPHPGDMFGVVAGDIFAPDFRFRAPDVQAFIASGKLAHLWLVPNPPQHPQGDFGLSDQGLALAAAPLQYTYAAIGLYRRELFELPWFPLPPGNPAGVAAPLAPLLRRAMTAGQVSACLYRGRWTDVGTPQRLAELNAALARPA